MEEKITKYVTEKRAAIFLVFLAAFFAGNIAAACVMKYQGTEERQSGINGMTEMKGGNNADASENVEIKRQRQQRYPAARCFGTPQKETGV